jgi:hypothetical protein
MIGSHPIATTPIAMSGKPAGLSGRAGAALSTTVGAATRRPLSGRAGGGFSASLTAVSLGQMSGRAGGGLAASVDSASRSPLTGRAGAGLTASVTQQTGLRGRAGAGLSGAVTASARRPLAGRAGAGLSGTLDDGSRRPLEGAASTGLVATIAGASRLPMAGRVGAGAVFGLQATTRRPVAGSAGAALTGTLVASLRDPSLALTPLGVVWPEWVVPTVMCTWFEQEDVMRARTIVAGSTAAGIVTLYDLTAEGGLQPLDLTGCGAPGASARQVDPDTGETLGAAVSMTASIEGAPTAGQMRVEHPEGMSPGLYEVRLRFTDGAGQVHVYPAEDGGLRLEVSEAW